MVRRSEDVGTGLFATGWPNGKRLLATDRSAEGAHDDPCIVQKVTVAFEYPVFFTRDCLDPWRIAFVQADASVRPCCFFEEKLGTLATESLTEVVEGMEFRKLRRELLTGELRPNCRSCSARPLIDRAAFVKKLSAMAEAEARASSSPAQMHRPF